MRKVRWAWVWGAWVGLVVLGRLLRAAQYDERLQTALMVGLLVLSGIMVFALSGPVTKASVSAYQGFRSRIKSPPFKLRLGIILCLIGIGLPLIMLPLTGTFTGIPLFFALGIVAFLCGLGLVLFAVVGRRM